MGVNNMPMQPGEVNSIPITVTGAANFDRTGAAGAFTKICTAGPDGARLERIDFISTGATTAGFILIFEADAGGGNKKLIGELAVTATGAAPDATNPAFGDTWTPRGGEPRHITKNREIWVCSTKGETFVARPDCGNL